MTLSSAYADAAVAGGHATPDDLQRIAAAWRRWGTDEDAWFTVVHGEVMCRVRQPDVR